jgi:hypothetical protein
MTTSSGMNRFALLISAALLLVGCFDLSVKDYTPSSDAAAGGASGGTTAAASESNSAAAGSTESRSSGGGGLGGGGGNTGGASSTGRASNTGSGGGGVTGSSTRVATATNTGGIPPLGGIPSGGALGSGGASTSSDGLTCPQIPAKDPVLCDFEHLKLNEERGSYACQAGDGTTLTFYAGAAISGTNDAAPTQEEAHSGTTALAFSMTAKGSALLRTGSLFVDFTAPADPNAPTGPVVYNPYPCVDVSAATGMTFWVKGTPAPFKMTFYEQTGDSSISTFYYRFTPTKDWTWSKQSFRWSDLIGSSTSGAGFRPQRLKFVTFGLDPIQMDISLYLDDMSFTTE